jgi:hypothetical protein
MCLHLTRTLPPNVSAGVASPGDSGRGWSGGGETRVTVEGGGTEMLAADAGSLTKIIVHTKDIVVMRVPLFMRAPSRIDMANMRSLSGGKRFVLSPQPELLATPRGLIRTIMLPSIGEPCVVTTVEVPAQIGDWVRSGLFDPLTSRPNKTSLPGWLPCSRRVPQPARRSADQPPLVSEMRLD